MKCHSYRSNNCNAAYIPGYEIQLPVIGTRIQILCRRDVGNHKIGSAETFFLVKASYTLTKKNVSADPILQFLTSRRHIIVQERYSYHSLSWHQGSPDAEHPNDTSGDDVWMHLVDQVCCC